MQKDEWTLKTNTEVGRTYTLSFHAVKVLSITERQPDFLRCKVQVLGPVPGSAGRTNGIPNTIPPLMFGGKLYDSEGAFVTQPGV